MKSYYIYTPCAPQSLSIAKLLKENSDCNIFGIAETKSGCSLYNGFVRESDIDFSNGDNVVVPTGAKSTEQLLKQRDVNLGSITMKRASLAVYDKIEFLKKAESCGVPVPKTWLKSSDIKDGEFPVFYKQKQEKGGGVRGVAMKRGDIPQSQDELIFQTFINTKGTYGVGFLASDGKLITHFIHYERESIPPQGGSAVVLEKFNDERLVKYTEMLVEKFNFSGWGLAEFKMNNDKSDFVLMEINAKFWASCEFAFKNNPVFFKELFDLNIHPQNIDRMVFLDRAWENGVLCLFSTLPSCFNSTVVFQYKSLKRMILLFVPKFLKTLLIRTYKKIKGKK